MSSPYNLNKNDSYLSWRNKKLSQYPLDISSLFTTIKNSNQPTESETSELKNTVSQHNLALYRFLDSALRDKTAVHTLGKRLGVTSIG